MSDSLAMTARGLRLSVRKPDALITGLTLPPMILLVFVYLFGGAVNIGTRYPPAGWPSSSARTASVTGVTG